jgi:hypothetical protein
MSKMWKRMGEPSRESTNMPKLQEPILERAKKKQTAKGTVNKNGEKHE